MGRVVYVGGFGNGQSLVDGVGEVLASVHGDADVFTFSQARRDPERVRAAVRDVRAYSHSAGMLALKDAAPAEIHAIAPPLPTSIGKLVGKSLVKNVRIFGGGTAGPAVRYLASSAAELSTHPASNFGALREISDFNAVSAAVNAEHAGIPVSLAFMHDDEFFQPDGTDYRYARHHGVDITQMPGRHDEVALRPAEVLDMYHSNQGGYVY